MELTIFLSKYYIVMCGRFSTAMALAEVMHWFMVEEDRSHSLGSYNVAPEQSISAVYKDEDKIVLENMVWGFIPHWAKNLKEVRRPINARAERVHESPMYRSAFAKQRCIIPAAGFYEWKKVPKRKFKQPYYISIKDQPVMGFAGIWSNWKSPLGGDVKSCAIITTEPNKMMKKIHNRMPVVLAKKEYKDWLEPNNEKKLVGMLDSYPEKEMDAFEVSTFVNNPTNQGEQCIAPLK